jgi:hypothetical protein
MRCPAQLFPTASQQQLAMPIREQLGDERHRRLAELRDLDPQLALPGLDVPEPEPAAQTALWLRPALVTGAPDEVSSSSSTPR